MLNIVVHDSMKERFKELKPYCDYFILKGNVLNCRLSNITISEQIKRSRVLTELKQINEDAFKRQYENKFNEVL